MSAVQLQALPQFLSHTCDPLGRWVHTRLQGRNQRIVNIFTVYKVCRNAKPGYFTSNVQQLVARALAEATEIDPRKRFTMDLLQVLQPIHKRKESLIVMGDFNEEISKIDSTAHCLCSSLDLTDVLFHRASSHLATYNRGTKRIDYVLLSLDITSTVVAAGYEDFSDF